MIWDGRQWISGILLVEVGLGLYLGLPADSLIGSTLGHPPLFCIQICRYIPLHSGGDA